MSSNQNVDLSKMAALFTPNQIQLHVVSGYFFLWLSKLIRPIKYVPPFSQVYTVHHQFHLQFVSWISTYLIYPKFFSQHHSLIPDLQLLHHSSQNLCIRTKVQTHEESQLYQMSNPSDFMVICHYTIWSPQNMKKMTAQSHRERNKASPRHKNNVPTTI